MDESSQSPIATAPTSYPLYVRLRAVVADWSLPKEERKERKRPSSL